MVVYSFSLVRGKNSKMLPMSFACFRLEEAVTSIWTYLTSVPCPPFPPFPPFPKTQVRSLRRGREGFANFLLICYFVTSEFLPQNAQKTCKNFCRDGGISFQEKKEAGGTRQVASLTLLPLPPSPERKGAVREQTFPVKRRKENSLFFSRNTIHEFPLFSLFCGTIPCACSPLRVIVFSFFPQTLSLAIRFWSLAKFLLLLSLLLLPRCLLEKAPSPPRRPNIEVRVRPTGEEAPRIKTVSTFLVIGTYHFPLK